MNSGWTLASAEVALWLVALWLAALSLRDPRGGVLGASTCARLAQPNLRFGCDPAITKVKARREVGL